MAKPSDTQCVADVGTEKKPARCENTITFDEAGDYWSKFCKDHNDQLVAARVGEGEWVNKFETTKGKKEE